MRLALLAAVRVVTRATYAVLDTPARLRAAVRAVDALAERLLDPPAVVIEREQTVPDYLQLRIAGHEAFLERTAAQDAEIVRKLAEGAARLEQLDQELFAIDPFN
jgi:hypothetical protein